MKEEPKMTSKRDLGTSQKLLDKIFDQQISPKVLRHLEINEGKKCLSTALVSLAITFSSTQA